MNENWKSAPVLCRLKRSNTPRISVVKMDDATKLVEKCFDYKFNGVTEVYPYVIPNEVMNLDVNIIQIVGPSGSGKSTFLEAFKKAGWHYPRKKYDNSKAIISNFSGEDGVAALNAVGLGDKPTWVKPRNVLSTGEGFRADMALNLESNVMIDEYTSVINREVAKSSAIGIQRYIRENGFKNVILCGCHDDIVEYLKPDIVISTETGKVYDLRGFCLGKPSTSPSSALKRSGRERSGKYSLRITI
jgi:ABC-type ATPase with predicted acetyltransferase domain